MVKLWLCSLCAVAMLGLGGCTVTVYNTPVGTVVEDGSVYLGWTLISRKKGKDWIGIGKDQGKFSSLRFRVSKRPFAVQKMVVTFGNGQKWSPKLRPKFGKDSWSRELKLPKGQRFVKKVTFFGRSVGKRGGMSRVDIYGQR